MRRKVSILLIFMQCIIGGMAAAEIGHTGNNGGGLGDIDFNDIWKNLENIMAPCLNPANLCGLQPEQIKGLRQAIQARAEVNTNYKSNDFYSTNGAPLSRRELTALALSSVLGCETRLTGIDVRLLGARLLDFSYYRELSGGQTVSLEKSKSLKLISATGQLDLTQRLSEKLRVARDFELQISDLSSRQTSSGIEIHGAALLDPRTRVHFQFRIAGSDVELLVYP